MKLVYLITFLIDLETNWGSNNPSKQVVSHRKLSLITLLPTFYCPRNDESKHAPLRCLCDWSDKSKLCRHKAFPRCEWGHVSLSDLFLKWNKGNGGTGMVSLQYEHACVLSCEQWHLWSKNNGVVSCWCRCSPSPIPWLLPRQSLDHHCSASPVEDAILLMNPRKWTYQRKSSIKSYYVNAHYFISEFLSKYVNYSIIHVAFTSV